MEEGGVSRITEFRPKGRGATGIEEREMGAFEKGKVRARLIRMEGSFQGKKKPEPKGKRKQGTGGQTKKTLCSTVKVINRPVPDTHLLPGPW